MKTGCVVIVAMVEVIPHLCVFVRLCQFYIFFFATGKTQIIAHEMLFIQSSSSVTILAQQHSTPHWRNTTEQISVKITVWRFSPTSPSIFIIIIIFFHFLVSPPSRGVSRK